MVKNRSLAKSITDASWSKFISILEYKAEWYGKSVHKIHRYFASSKTCSDCGFQIDKLDLSVRNWTCPDCGEIHDRDINAARNILQRGIFKEEYSKRLRWAHVRPILKNQTTRIRWVYRINPINRI
jgi:putative transposase